MKDSGWDTQFIKFVYKLCVPATILKLYLSTVHPHLEYASSVWDPYLKKNIDAIEHVQKFALKVCQKDWHSDYDTLLNATNVPPPPPPP